MRLSEYSKPAILRDSKYPTTHLLHSVCKMKICAYLFCFAVVVCHVTSLPFEYHSNLQLELFLRKFTELHKNLTKMYSIGKSINGVDLWVIELSASPRNIGVPHVKLIGNIHGNEAIGREILLHFLEYLVENYPKHDRIKWFLENTRLYILPSLNPDGFANASEGLCSHGLGRENKNNSDLNRSFPDFFQDNLNAIQPETSAIIKWMDKVPFILSASLHGGALVANYPYESVPVKSTSSKRLPHRSPDDDVFRHLALVYSRAHSTMHEGHPCDSETVGFVDGITNGAAWYSVTGGMQDYNYAFKGCMEITLEISCCKYPESDEIPNFWEENKDALLSYIYESHRGITGQVVDSATSSPIFNASCLIQGRNMTFYTSNRGEFWRILLEGNYTLQVSADGYRSATKNFTLQFTKLPIGLKKLLIKLVPLNSTDTTSSTTSTVSEDTNNSSHNKTTESVVTTPSSVVNNCCDNETKTIRATSASTDQSTNQNALVDLSPPLSNITDSFIYYNEVFVGAVRSRSGQVSVSYLCLILCFRVALFSK